MTILACKSQLWETGVTAGRVVNTSVWEDRVPDVLKFAVVWNLLGKPSLDADS